MSVQLRCYFWPLTFVTTRLPLEFRVRPLHSYLTVGKIVKTFFTGDEKITYAKRHLQECVEGYSTALGHIAGIQTILKVYELVNELKNGEWYLQID
jgi:hypothetical protein